MEVSSLTRGGKSLLSQIIALSSQAIIGIDWTQQSGNVTLDWIGLCRVLRLHHHSIGYIGDGFYRSKDPTNSIKVLKEKAVKEKNNKKQRKHKLHIIHTHKIQHTLINTASPLVYTNMG